MIAPMSRVEIVCLSSIRSELVELLQAKGLLHLEDAPLEIEDAPEFLNRVQLDGEEADRYSAADETDRMLAETVPLLTIQPNPFDVQAAAAKLKGLDAKGIGDAVRGGAERIREIVRKRASLQDQIDVIENYKRILDSVAPALGANVRLGEGTKAIVLTGNVNRAASSLEQRLIETFGSDCTFHKNQTSRRHLVGLITFPKGREDEVSRILTQEGVAPVEVQSDEYQDQTIGEVLQRIESTLAKNRSELGALEGELNKASREAGADLKAAHSIVRDQLAQFNAQNQFSASQMLTVIHGWTPSDAYGALENAVEESFPGQVEVTRLEFDSHQTSPPTQLRNHPFFRPFETVMKLFKPPLYGTVDPTWMVGTSFVVFYGFILGDAAYGLVIVLLSRWIQLKWGSHPIVADVAKIALYMGVSAIIWGVIFGEYFGNFVELWLWPTVFGSEFHLYLFHRAHETTQTLVYAIYFGLFHIFAALFMGIREDFRHGHQKHAYEKLGMALTLLALVINVFAYFEVSPFTAGAVRGFSIACAVVGVLLIFYAMKFMGFIGVLEVMSLGGNILSYGRLMALGVASIALADIANMLPSMMGWVIGIPAALLVHVLNIGIGIASPTIHSLRLNFVEFLPKFYAPQGRGFNPFRKEAQW